MGQRGARAGAPGPAGRADSAEPTVSLAIPVWNEAALIERCLAAVDRQDYPGILEVLVVDGGSTDATVTLAARHPQVRIVDNPRRSRPAAMNLALREAAGEVLVRVDARTTIAPDYVGACVAALARTQATIVGGPMGLEAHGPRPRGVARAMSSRLGAGPAAFRRPVPEGRFVDTVYLGAFRVDEVRALGGYDEDFGGNEDAELNFRARQRGGVFLDPAIRSTYAVRPGLVPLAGQFRRYGRARARTMRKHPASVAPRQLAVPALVAGLLSPWRRPVALAYSTAILARGLLEAFSDPAAAPWFTASLVTMHGAWAAGFAEGILTGPRAAPPPTRPDPPTPPSPEASPIP